MSAVEIANPAARSHTSDRGFRPLEEIDGLWSEGNPRLLMVKRLPS